MLNNADYRYGSAALATLSDARKAGLLNQTALSLFVGFMGDTPLWYSGMGGVLLVAGARGGKLRDLLGYNICHSICRSTMLILDMKGELAAVSADQTPDRKHCIYWNPLGLHGLGRRRIARPTAFLVRHEFLPSFLISH